MHDPDTVTVVMDNNYPPFSFRDANGNLVGISVDMWRLWEKQTGKKVAITGLGWDDAIRRMESGEFDVIDTVFYSDERAKIYDFTPPYTDVDVVIFFNANVSGISTLDSLNGFVVGMHKGDSTVEDVVKKGVTVREYDSYEDVVTAAKTGEIVVFILDKPSGVYYLHKQGIQDQFRQTPPVIKGALHRAVKKGDTALLAEINTGFAKIPRGDYEALDRTWYGTPVMNTDYLRVVAVFAGAVFLIIVFLVAWNCTLNRTVAQKTSELNAELEQRKQAEEARRENEKFLDNIVENIPVMVFVKEAKDLRFIRFNRAGEELLGYSREELAGKNDYAFFPKEQADFFTAKDTAVILKQQILDIPEERIQTKNYGERILHTKKIPLMDNEGIPQYLLGISEDITERKRAEEELHQKSEELSAAYEEMTATAEELRQNYDELHRSQQALEHARKKLNLLNTVTFQDIQNAVFSLSGFLHLEKQNQTGEELQWFHDKQIGIVQSISESLKFAAQYQNLGIQPPRWQNVQQMFLVGISHINLTGLSRQLEVKDIEIYADPLLEQVFFSLAENVILHGKTATKIALHYRETSEGLTLVFEDNGVGVQDEIKEDIFIRKYEEKKGMGLFLVREILSITGISIKETGEPGNGARFEIMVPNNMWRKATEKE